MFYFGLDESGHGSIAGPMTVGLVRVQDSFEQQQLWDLGACDSKLTTEHLREHLCEEMSHIADLFALVIPVEDINNMKHSHAFDKHVGTFIDNQSYPLEMYIDGLRTIDNLECKATYIANGDQSNALIAAASIVGKYAHDIEINLIDKMYPEWDFKNHRGYPIPDHVSKILDMKPIPGVHKLNPTFTAIKNYCKKNNLKVPKWASSKDKLKKLLCN